MSNDKESLRFETIFHARPGPKRKWNTLRVKPSSVGYTPSSRQAVFHSSPAEVVFYGGAAGGGKSLALLMDAYAHCRDAGGRHALLMRRTYPELEGSLILKSHEVFPKQICEYNEIKRRWIIKARDGGESLLEFGFCRLDKDKYKYHSREFTYLGIDESTHFTWSIFSYMLSRARTAKAGNPVRIRLASNPGNVGHSWHKRYFGLSAKSGIIPEKIWTPSADIENDPQPLPRCFIPARVQDNTHLMQADPGYVKRLMLLPPVTRRRLLEGNWEDVEGKYFDDFSAEGKYVIKPFDIPRTWKFYRAIDYGFTKPFVCLWIAMAPDGHAYVYRELYQSGLRDIEQAQYIKKLSKEVVEYTMADPSMKNKNASGKSPAENYQAACDIALVPADNNRIPGWMSIRNWLAPMDDGKPGLMFFDTCPNVIREMEDAIRDEENPDDIDTMISDHAIDALRYWCNSRPNAPVIAEEDPYKHLDEASRREWIALDKQIKLLTNSGNQAILHDMHRED